MGTKSDMESHGFSCMFTAHEEKVIDTKNKFMTIDTWK